MSQLLERLFSTRSNCSLPVAALRISDELTRRWRRLPSRTAWIAHLPAALAQDGMSYRQFRDQIRREMIIARVQQNRVNDRIAAAGLELPRFTVGRAATTTTTSGTSACHRRRCVECRDRRS